MRFVDLLHPATVSPPEQQIEASNRFPTFVAKSRLHLWSPGDPIEQQGLRLLLGVSPSYCVYDLILLDDVNAALLTGTKEIRVDVFDMNVCHAQADIHRFFPAVLKVLQTPVLGIWSMGQLTEVLQGNYARERLRVMTSAQPDPGSAANDFTNPTSR